MSTEVRKIKKTHVPCKHKKGFIKCDGTPHEWWNVEYEKEE